MFEEGFWKCSWVTQNLCFAALNPDDKQTDIAEYETAFRQYRQIIGQVAAQEFDRHFETATPPAIFHAYMQAMDAGIRTEIRRVFVELLNMGVAQESQLQQHPADWAKAH